MAAHLGPHGRLEAIGHVRISLPGGCEKTVVIPVRSMRRALRSRHQIALTVKVTVTNASGLSSESSSTVTF
jgi:hypothetical protein